jgi:hypothetical protein
MDMDEAPPRFLWRAVVGGTLSLVVVLGLLAGVLAAGAADPRRAGDSLYAENDFSAIELSPHQIKALTLENPLPQNAFTLEAHAELLLESDPSAAWGFWLQNDATYLIFAISGEGYVTARNCPTLETLLEDCPTLKEPDQGIETSWKSIHFIRPTENSLRLDLRDGVLSLRINHEWMWNVEGNPAGEFGLWMSGGRDTTAIFEIKNITLYGK